MTISEVTREIKRLEPQAAELYKVMEDARKEDLAKWLKVQGEIDRLKKEREKLLDALVAV